MHDAKPYSLLIRDQAGAERLLRELGALQEIERAIVEHCEGHRPAPPYRPQALKDLLDRDGWQREVRVPPFSPQYDSLPINERYDAWKSFDRAGTPVGVAIEFEPWEVWNDLLKFRRGLERGQICAGVLIHDSPYHLQYVYEHMRSMSEPLFGHIPILFGAPGGPGLKQPSPSERKYQPFRMP
jgi:hypothetical protein